MNYRLIKNNCESKNIAFRTLATRIGISEVGLHQMIRNRSMKIDVFEKICNELEVDPRVFFDLNFDCKGNVVKEPIDNYNKIDKSSLIRQQRIEIEELKSKLLNCMEKYNALLEKQSR